MHRPRCSARLVLTVGSWRNRMSHVATTPASSPALEVLGREECLRLLAQTSFGRLAINLRSELPMIRPVNYVFDERTQSILFRTDFGSKFQGMILAARA